jgi:hypothetical protein
MGLRDFVDHDALRELELTMENESSLYRQKQDIVENLRKKVVKGVYDRKQAPKLWMYWVEKGARLYGKEHGSGEASGLKMFSPATRRALAEKFARDYETMPVDDGGLGLPSLPPGTVRA